MGGGPGQGLEQIIAMANLAFAMGAFALTLSMILRGGRREHSRSWIFFSAAAAAILVHAATLLPGSDGGLRAFAPVFGLAATALLSIAFLFLYGADRKGVDRLQQVAEEDHLTGLYNRRAFTDLASPRIARSIEHGGLCTVVVIDLDGFKQVNDRQGHQAGDRMLQVVGTAIRAAVRPADIAGRYGGDEFVLFLDRCSADEARAITERIQRNVVVLAAVGGSYLTLSAGLAVCPEHGTTLDELVRRADAALREVKQGGKNGVAAA